MILIVILILKNITVSNKIQFVQYNPNIQYKIPFILHQTWISYETIPEQVKIIIEDNKKICPEFEYRFYQDEDCVKFIKDNFENNVLDAYNCINPEYSAARADIFRYCVLYIYGGVYLDIKSKIKLDLKTIIDSNDECILLEGDFYIRYITELRLLNNFPMYEQWALIFKPGHPYLKECIDQIVINFNNRYIPSGNSKTKILKLTGPELYSKSIHNYRKRNDYFHKDKIYNIFDIFDYSPIQHKKILYANKKYYGSSENNLYNC